VGLLYDCPNRTAHQVTSICYNPDCTKDKPIHTFHDDSISVSKELLDTNFKVNKNGTTVNTGLNHSCENKGINVQFVLFEKQSVTAELQLKVDSFKTANPANYPASVIVKGGGYKQKYLKYKQKYIQLKKILSNNFSK